MLKAAIRLTRIKTFGCKKNTAPVKKTKQMLMSTISEIDNKPLFREFLKESRELKSILAEMS